MDNLIYQQNYSAIDASMLDSSGRRQKAEKIIQIILDYCQHSNHFENRFFCLELGCSAGGMTSEFAKVFRHVAAIDIDRRALVLAQKRHRQKKITFRYGDVLALPYRDESFDLVIANHVYEHVTNVTRMVNEIYRVLKPRGLCYLSGPQKYTVIEPHYMLPFLSWLPRKFASVYLKITGKGDYYFETPLPSWELKRLVGQFRLTDYTLAVIKNPRVFRSTHPFPGVLSRIPMNVYRCIYPLLPSFFWILEKRS